MKLKWHHLILVFIIISSCEDESAVPLHSPPSFMELPMGFEDFEVPSDNQFTQERWDLGKKLFFDPIMSLDSSISCASCHNPNLAFSDDKALSLGVESRIGTRNSPTLANVGFHPYYTREGGIPTLEMQVLVPIQEHNEFDFNIVLLAERLLNDSAYVEMALHAYNRSPDAFVIARALACFERSLISGYSRYDHYENYNDQNALSSSEVNGLKLFFSDKTNCSKCHGGFNFTNYEFNNNGLYDNYLDSGRFRLTGDDIDFAKFKVPTMRNVELTAPYMHDGSFNNLEEVIEHYNSGGFDNPQKSAIIKPLGLTQSEKNDLLAFLKSLTDNSFVNNPIFKND